MAYARIRIVNEPFCSSELLSRFFICLGGYEYIMFRFVIFPPACLLAGLQVFVLLFIACSLSYV